jgi:ABC-2 type transport system ATP-binding protein
MQTATSLAIDVHGLTKRYGGRNVVDHISLQVETGRIVGFSAPTAAARPPPSA